MENKPPSAILWMVTKQSYIIVAARRVELNEVVKDGFEKITAAKAFKDTLTDPGLKIIPYYE